MHFFVIVSSVSFDSTPGLKRYQKGDDVLFTWMLDTKPKTFYNIKVTYNNIEIITKGSTGLLSYDSRYTGRASFMASEKTIRLTLNNVNNDDAIYGVYKLTVTVTIDQYLETATDESAKLYLFGKYNHFFVVLTIVYFT